VTLRELRRDYDAVLFALGRTESVPLDIPGAQLRGVCQAYPFILHHTSDTPLHSVPVNVQGRQVVVLGAGDTAMDALRIALRAGARDALCIYRRDRENIPADPKEFDNALEEGARFLYRSQPVAILGQPDGEVTRVRCLRTLLGAPDATGRSSVRPLPETEFEVPAEVVLVAYGFAPPRLPECQELAALARDEHGCLLVNADQMTSLPGVFAAGSIARWPVSMIEVMKDARKAATEMDRYLAARRATG
jgi:glutamate synthase (NADPH/NADH) small chain